MTAIHAATATLPFGFTVEFHGTAVGTFGATWDPHVPDFRRHPGRAKMVRAYVKARDVFLGDLATKSGRTISVLDIGEPLKIFKPAKTL